MFSPPLTPFSRDAIFGHFSWKKQRLLKSQIPILRDYKPSKSTPPKRFTKVEFYKYFGCHTIILVDDWRIELTPKGKGTEISRENVTSSFKTSTFSKLKVEEILKNLLEKVLDHNRIQYFKSANEPFPIFPLNAKIEEIVVTSPSYAPIHRKVFDDIKKINPKIVEIKANIESGHPHLELKAEVLKIDRFHDSFPVFMQFIKKLHAHQPGSFFRAQDFSDRSFDNKAEFLKVISAEYPNCQLNRRNIIIIPINANWSINIQFFKFEKQSEEITGGCVSVRVNKP